MSATRNPSSEPIRTEAPEPARRPPLPRPDTSRGYGPQGHGKVAGSQPAKGAGKQFSHRKH